MTFKLVSIHDIFVPTLLNSYNQLVDAVIVGAVILPELLIVPVFILLVELNIFSFVSNWVWVIPPLEEIILFLSIVIFVPDVNIFCFVSNWDCNEDKPLPIFTPLIIALLEVIEPLAKILPATSNAYVAVEFSPSLNPLAVRLCKTSPAFKINCVFAL